MNTKVLYSVFKRNFVSYLSNPTGYVFICVFVLLSSVAAFLPDEFFNANLANLDQLNIWFPLIMLVFVPAITMGIWADEKRQGTDELLLTIPASDFDIVLGKFKAAVSIYFVALLFSLICNLMILKYLGSPDIGLFISTYLGYFLVGVSMISVGMVASFLTGNLTVAYVLGSIFCAPLIALQWIDAAPVMSDTAAMLKSFSIASQFELFGRGVFSVSSVIYFGMITSTMLYLSMVLIGRRHWATNRKWLGAFHYAVRTISLLVIGLSVVFIFRHHDLRADLTEEKIGTLTQETINLLKNLKPTHPVVIDAFLSSDIPDSHIQTRLNIISTLDEIRSICGNNVSVQIHLNMQPNTNEALLANQRYGIKPQGVAFSSRGQRSVKNIFLGVAFRSGLNTLTLPFIDRSLSVEYELVHALCNVTMPVKKRVGVLRTDASLLGRVDMRTYRMQQQWIIVDALKRQYTVVEVDPKEPITERFDALLAVQPSALDPAETQNFIDAVKSGQPTVIFEDPFPVYVDGVPGTADPRTPQGGMMGMFSRPQPKGSLEPLWNFLGVRVDGSQIVWQDYSPIRKIDRIPKVFVFLDRSLDRTSNKRTRNQADEQSPFMDDSVVSSLEYLMFPFTGHVVKEITSKSKFTITPILRTFKIPSGVVTTHALQRGLRDGSYEQDSVTDNLAKDIAVRVRGELPAPPPVDVAAGEKPVLPEPVKIEVLLIADIDVLSNEIFTLRQIASDPSAGGGLDFDNVNFVLNAIDSVSGDERFLTIRNRRPKHRTLSRFDENTDAIRNATNQKLKELQDNFNKWVEAEKNKLTENIEKLKTEYAGGSLGETEAAQRLSTIVVVLQKKFESEEERSKQKLNIAVSEAEVKLNDYIRTIQGRYKLAAVAIPPIPPLVIALTVFLFRRVRESEGIPKSRLRKQ
ncbi:MAG: Gldg family protein [Planctomycetaceae bacterium]|jgi:ABC-2 type transport system permease protein|nr:Gldg family protein [Planctomycetaceae bacterium]